MLTISNSRGIESTAMNLTLDFTMVDAEERAAYTLWRLTGWQFTKICGLY
jgi:hypothetical protein